MINKYGFSLLEKPVLIGEHVWPEGTLPFVSISIFTYNHEQYIRECIEGMLIQKTTFPVQICIFEDCSSDNTAEIIKEYELKFPNLIKSFYQSINTYRKRERKEALEPYNEVVEKAKYIAFCEGDDYWTDPYKLQMQADYLEKHVDYGMCYTQAKVYLNSSKKFSKKRIGSDYRSFKYLLYHGNRIPTLTAFFRTELYVEYCNDVKPESKLWLMGDYPIWLWFARESKLSYIPKITGVYRVLNESASKSNSFEKRKNFIESTYEIRRYFINKYAIEIESLDSQKNLSLALYSFLYNEIMSAEMFLKKVKRLRLFKDRVKYYLLRNRFLRHIYITIIGKL